MLMFCFLRSQLHKTNLKTLFACNVKTWLVWSYYSTVHCCIQCWVWRTGRFTSPLPQYLLNVSFCGPLGWTGTVAGMNDIFQLQHVVRSDCPVVQPVLQLLYRLSCPECHIWVYLWTECV